MSMLTSDQVNSILDAMQDINVQPDSFIDFITDGQYHSYDIAGYKKKSLKGWYIFYSDGTLPAGAFGSWKTGLWSNWCSKSEQKLSPAEREEWRRKIDAARVVRENEKLQVRKEAAKKAERLWDIAHFTSVIAGNKEANEEAGHPYLLAKGIKPYGIKQLKDSLVVAVRNESGALTSLQFIQADGQKKFMTGGEITGSYFAIGRHASIVCICEGLATGSSIHEATGYSVAVAFNSGNLPHVAKVIREKFPAYTLIICADNDVDTEGNPGLSKAVEAAEQVHGMLAVAKFQDHELIRGKRPTDFNDLHQLHGLDAVRDAIEEAAFGEAVLPAIEPEVIVEVPKLTLKEFEALIDEADDFEVLTDELPKRIALSGLKRPAIEMLVAKIAKKASVPKSALLEEMTAFINQDKKKTGDDNSGRIELLNQKHAIIPLGGRILILNRDYEPVMQRDMFSFSAKTDFETRYCNRKVWEAGEQVGLGTLWLNHANRAEYDGMVFAPGSDHPGYLNLWMGWGIEPKKGCCQRYLDFVFDVICSKDGDLFDYIIHWLAHLVQRPGELPETALVFRGKEGIGKNKFVEPIETIVGHEHFLMLSSMSQVIGRFSGHLANALLVFCNETLWGGDKSGQGALKSMITDKIQPVEYKGRDLAMLRSYKRLIFATNEEWAVPRGADDRRYVITDVSPAAKGKYTYFKDLSDSMDNGGTAALFDYLNGWDISEWHPRMIPNKLSMAGWELKIQSGSSIVQWWFDMLQRGWLEKMDSHYAEHKQLLWPERIETEILQNSYLTWCLQYKVTHPQHSTVLGKQLREWGVLRAKPRTDNPSRKPFYLLPSLEQSQDIFADRFTIPASVWQGIEESD